MEKAALKGMIRGAEQFFSGCQTKCMFMLKGNNN